MKNQILFLALILPLSGFAWEQVSVPVPAQLQLDVKVSKPRIERLSNSGNELSFKVSTEVEVTYCKMTEFPRLTVESIEETSLGVIPNLGGAVAVSKTYNVKLSTIQTTLKGTATASSCLLVTSTISLPCDDDRHWANFKNLNNPDGYEIRDFSAIDCSYSLNNQKFLTVEAFVSGRSGGLPSDQKAFEARQSRNSQTNLQQPNGPAVSQALHECKVKDEWQFGSPLSFTVDENNRPVSVMIERIQNGEFVWENYPLQLSSTDSEGTYYKGAKGNLEYPPTVTVRPNGNFELEALETYGGSPCL